jgi:hypothetical protein
VDRVWSGHPVNFALLTERGHQFIAYYDTERRLTVAGRTSGSERWKRVKPDGVVTDWDSHNYLRLALDRDGCLHLSGNMHNDPLVYYRTSKPFDLATLERIDHMTGDREHSVTYPVFFKNAAGDLLFRYRDGGSGRGSDIYNFYDSVARTWRHLLDTPLLDGQSERSAYTLDPVLGPDGRFHLVWMWRDTPDCATNHTLSYARSHNFVHWETSRGEPLSLPITLARGEVIDPAKPGDGLINMTFNLGFDAEKRPVVVYHRYDTQGCSQVYAAQPSWDVRPISTWNFRWSFSGRGSIPAEVTLGAPWPAEDGGLLVDFWTKAVGSGRWRVGERVELLPPAPSVLPQELMRASAGMEVHTVASRDGGHRWVLRWETLPRNRDLPRKEIPPPSELRLFEFPDADTNTAERVGS